MNIKSSEGFSLIELLVVITFLGVMTLMIFNVSYFNNRLRKINEEQIQAMFYATEAMEIAQLVSWDNLLLGDMHPVKQGNTWVLNAGAEVIDLKYNRTISIESVERASSTNGHIYGDISPGDYVDPSTKKVSVTIDWTSRTGLSKQEKLETYFHRWEANRWIQNDWVAGSGQDNWLIENMFFSNDAGVDVSVDGIATLLSGFLDWNNGTTTDTYNLPGSSQVNAVYEDDDKVYLVRNNYSSGDELYIFDVSDIYNVSVMDSYNVGSSVTSVVVKDGFAYMSGKSAEFIILDVSDPYDISWADSYNIGGGSNGLDVVVDETEAYILREYRLYSFSIADPYDIQYLDQFDIDDDAKRMFLSENHIYVTAYDGNRELQIFDITNPANLDSAGTYDLPGTQTGTDIFVKGSTAYMSVDYDSSRSEFFVFDISDPDNPILTGEYEAGNTIYAITVIGPYAILGVNNSNEELVVIDISFPATINKAAGFNLDGNIYSMVANCSNVYNGVANGSQEFLVFSTEEVNCGYAEEGVLESSTFDTGSDEVVYNWVSWTGSKPANTSIEFQIATSDNINGPWNFVGPDATGGTYYTSAQAEFINYNHHLNQRYLRYKLYLGSQASLQAPILEDVIISYSAY